jgi:hypothetical protein
VDDETSLTVVLLKAMRDRVSELERRVGQLEDEQTKIDERLDRWLERKADETALTRRERADTEQYKRVRRLRILKLITTLISAAGGALTAWLAS